LIYNLTSPIVDPVGLSAIIVYILSERSAEH
jgi:hypothetical protein